MTDTLKSPEPWKRQLPETLDPKHSIGEIELLCKRYSHLSFVHSPAERAVRFGLQVSIAVIANALLWAHYWLPVDKSIVTVASIIGWILIIRPPRLFAPNAPSKPQQENKYLHGEYADIDILRMSLFLFLILEKDRKTRARLKWRTRRAIELYAWCPSCISYFVTSHPLGKSIFEVRTPKSIDFSGGNTYNIQLLCNPKPSSPGIFWSRTIDLLRRSAPIVENRRAFQDMAGAWLSFAYWLYHIKPHEKPSDEEVREIEKRIRQYDETLTHYYSLIKRTPGDPNAGREILTAGVFSCVLMLAYTAIITISGNRPDPATLLSFLGILATIWVSAWQIRASRVSATASSDRTDGAYRKPQDVSVSAKE